MKKGSSIDTAAVHAGYQRSPGFRGTVPPIETSSAFLAESVEQLYGVFRGEPGVVYSRIGNPTVQALERAMAELEGGTGAVALASGMGALHAAWLSCGIHSGDVVLVSRDCYGSTLTLLRELFERLGVRRVEADLCDSSSATEMIRETRPRIVHCEMISNPLLRIPDFPVLAKSAHEAGAKVVLDATFATPVLFRGLEHGADVVVHSLTKYLGGHGDLTGGVCITNDAETLASLRRTVVVGGAVLSPFDAWLTLRGLRTLPLRVRRQCENAKVIAQWLSEHAKIERVHFPGLASHPHHERASRLLQCGNFGAMVAFEIRNGTRSVVMRFMNALQLVHPATTLGDVWTLALYPAESSHRDLTAEELKAIGITAGLVRLSIGIEDPADIIADLDQALAPC